MYGEARRRGMDLVTLTDHNTIAGAMEIAALPRTFVSEEVSCRLPGGRELHIGVFDITERQHETIARRRHDAEALFAFLAEERIPAAVNHPFSALTGRRETADLHHALANVALVEARNGMMSAAVNDCAARAVRSGRKAAIGGSDAHTLASVAGAWTVVPGARTRDDFLDGLRRGLTLPAGRVGRLRATHRRRGPHRRGRLRVRGSRLRPRPRRRARAWLPSLPACPSCRSSRSSPPPSSCTSRRSREATTARSARRDATSAAASDAARSAVPLRRAWRGDP